MGGGGCGVWGVGLRVEGEDSEVYLAAAGVNVGFEVGAEERLSPQLAARPVVD